MARVCTVSLTSKLKLVFFGFQSLAAPALDLCQTPACAGNGWAVNVVLKYLKRAIPLFSSIVL